ncbi:HlyC/CorC family transporter [Paenibacillus ginsengarvi]|uniref:HlyC/CorC family transporter n=2 Tax=Paenibacillus ginsengarvi TaxID=400777 RepID=A0A3B0CJT7_9BACL|nr:HlyC/CorC family transporter [Paenibacillus ginsengarvi]
MIVLLVVLNGFFVAAEFAIVHIREGRIDSGALHGKGKGKAVRAIAAHVHGYWSACRLGTALTALGLGWIGVPSVALGLSMITAPLGVPGPILDAIACFAAFALIASLLLAVGEQVPRTYAVRRPVPVLLWTASPLGLIYRLMQPYIRFLSAVSFWMLTKSGVDPERESEPVRSGEEIRTLVKESHRKGLIDKTELVLVDNLFEFAETSSREVMIPRTEMICLHAGKSYEENKQIAISHMHTRYPVCDPDKDNIVGYVHIKDMFKHDEGMEGIMPITRPIMNVPDSMPISTLLRLMQKKRTEMALLIDEYGGTSGLVTSEDIMEELVGEIRDEFDEERPRFEQKSANAYSVDGLLWIDEVNNFFGTEITADNYDTIGGWLYAQIEMPPRRDQRVSCGGFEYTVEEVQHMRISRVIVHVPEQYEMPARQEVS